MKMIIGNYSPQGYELLGIDEDGQIIEEIYAAGNNRHESDPAQSLPEEFENALDLITIKRYCKQTGKAIANDRGIPFGGVEMTA